VKQKRLWPRSRQQQAGPPPRQAEKPPTSKGSVPKTLPPPPPAAAGTAIPLSREDAQKLIADRIKLGLVVDPEEVEIVDRFTFEKAYENAGWNGQGDLPAAFTDPTVIRIGPVGAGLEPGRKPGQPSGRLWIRQDADDPQNTFHEAIHSISIKASARNQFLQRFGFFLEEGITESLTRKHFGAPAAAHPYDPHVAFVKRLSSRLGISEEHLTRAYLDGDIEVLTRAIWQGLGRNRALADSFLGALRNVGTNVDNRQALSDAVYIMMTGTMPPAP
jgi:hypothetical protein